MNVSNTTPPGVQGCCALGGHVLEASVHLAGMLHQILMHLAGKVLEVPVHLARVVHKTLVHMASWRAKGTQKGRWDAEESMSSTHL